MSTIQIIAVALIGAVLGAAAVAVIAASLLRCKHCRRWHDCVEEEDACCRANNQKGQQ